MNLAQVAGVMQAGVMLVAALATPSTWLQLLTKSVLALAWT